MDATAGTISDLKSRSGWTSDWVCTLILLGLWVAMAIAINPIGDFPIGDDFGFAPPVWTLLETGRLKLTDWGAMNLASQVGWGAIFAAVLGKTYTALRISTLVAGALGALALYRLLRLSLTPGQALFGAVLLVTNPLYLFTAFTFLSDIPYTAMQMVALWLIVTGWKDESRWRLAVGWTVAAAALLCRQVGLAIPIAAACIYLLAKPINVRRFLLALAPILAFVALQHGYRAFLDATGGAPKLFGALVDTAADGLKLDLGEIVGRFAFFSAFAWLYFGLFLAPASLARLERPSAVGRWWLALFAGSVALGLLAFAHAASFKLMWFPYMAGIWQFDYGLGTEFSGTLVTPQVLIGQTALAVAGACLLGFTALPALARLRPRADPAPVFALLLALVLVAPIPLLNAWWDRYLIPLLPCVILVLSPVLRDLRGRALTVGFIAAVPLAAFSIAGTHDFMAFKRAQWAAYTDLRKTVPAEQIDAAWSINASHSLDQFWGKPLECWHTSQAFVIWPGARPGHIVQARYPVVRWLPWNRDDPDVYSLRATRRLPAEARGHGWASCGQ